MMGHGTHCSCMICSMGKAVGMIEKCTDKNCPDSSHKKETEEKDKTYDKQPGACSCC